jgi:hypothetical protein
VKRSEMVKVIEKAMRCWNGAYFNQSLESHILEYIEEAGMLPPHDGKAGRVIFEDVQYMIDHYTWEPEDER